MGNTDKFDLIANAYDTPERIQTANIASSAIYQFLSDTKEKSAIDFGCGTGLVGMNLLNCFKNVLFWDTSQNMIDQIKEKILKLNIQNADTLIFDLEKESKIDLHTDYIFMVQVLLHIKDTKKILTKLYDVLNQNGHLLIVDFDQNSEIQSEFVHCGFEHTELTKIMEDIGFKNVQIKTFYTGRKIFMGKDASLFVLDGIK